MRDPKAHAKHLALRHQRVFDAAIEAKDPIGGRLWKLSSRIANAADRHYSLTDWRYHYHATPPHWTHTTTHPDT